MNENLKIEQYMALEWQKNNIKGMFLILNQNVSTLFLVIEWLLSCIYSKEMKEV